MLSKLEAVLARALNTPASETPTRDGEPPAAAAAAERCSWLVPLVRTLLNRAYGPLGLQWGLPSLPPTNGSPTFFEDFQAFCATPEWRHFIDKQVPGAGGTGREVRAGDPHRAPVSCPCPILQVQPTMSQFEMDTYAKSHDLMSGFWNACYDMLMSSAQRRQRERARGRRAFQVCDPRRGAGSCSTRGPRGWLMGRSGETGTAHEAASGTHPFLHPTHPPTPQELVLEPAQRRARLEGLRYTAALKQQAAQHSTALLHWGALWRQLSSPCGAWALRWAGFWVESGLGGAWEGGARRVPLGRNLGGTQRSIVFCP